MSSSDDLLRAAVRGDAGQVQALLDNGANINATAKDGKTALMEASWKGHLPVVQLLLHRGAEVNSASKDGRTALMDASWRGHIEVVQALIEKGADVNAKANNGTTALAEAASYGHAAVEQALRDNGADDSAHAGDIKGVPAAADVQLVETVGDVAHPPASLWTYIGRGGEIGLWIGTTLFFAASIINILIAADQLNSPKYPPEYRPRVDGVAIFYLIWWAGILKIYSQSMSPDVKKLVNKATAILFPLGAVTLLLATKDEGFGKLIPGALTGMLFMVRSLVGFTVLIPIIAGAVFGGLPGIAIGTGVGIVRGLHLREFNGARQESIAKLVGMGILLPAACFVISLFLYVQYVIPSANESTAKFIQHLLD